jgi:hypothetical protein
MAVGIILGNFVENTGPALQKGKFVGVSIPIGMWIPTAMARKIHKARKRSNQPRPLKADCLAVDSSDSCFSTFKTIISYLELDMAAPTHQTGLHPTKESEYHNSILDSQPPTPTAEDVEKQESEESTAKQSAFKGLGRVQTCLMSWGGHIQLQIRYDGFESAKVLFLMDNSRINLD